MNVERKGVVHGYAKRKRGKLKEWGFIKRSLEPRTIQAISTGVCARFQEESTEEAYGYVLDLGERVRQRWRERKRERLCLAL